MGISGINANFSSMSAPAAGPDAQIKNLEWQLHRLESEKQQAAQARDEEKVRELEKRIEALKEKLQRLQGRGDETAPPLY